MGRPRKSVALGLWMNGEYVGAWRLSARGEHELHYAPDWVDSPRGRPVSLSMPLRPADAPYKGEVVRRFFDNLLPENRLVRERIAQRFGARNDPFGLLAEIGRDCVGALQLLPEGQAPRDVFSMNAAAMSEEAIARHLARLSQPAGFGIDDEGDFRLSLAGAQEKTAFIWHQGQWWRPQGSTPTTHIFKLPLGRVPQGIDLTTSVPNEWLCLRLLRAFGVPAATAAMLRFGEQEVLAVERFDRRPAAAGGWLRLPQEDFAQVYGIEPTAKYEDQGGPGIRAILDHLLGSAQAEADRRDFFRTQVLFWMLAAIDGHAKNYSIFIEPRGQFRLTPRYDVLSAYPVMGTAAGELSPYKARMAMAVWRSNRHYRWAEIRRQHFEATAADCHVPGAAALIDELIERTPAALAEVERELPRRFPAQVAGPVLAGVAKAARALAGFRPD